MVSVEQLIGDLLLRHNCVIIPSFGGFVAKQTPASIDYTNGVMAPPRKSLLFNRQLINNDGLLIAELAVSNSMQYTEATATVRAVVDSWNDQLRQGKRITIDKVGFLFFDQEKNICFEQDRFFNLLLESYGLGKVHFLTETDVQLAQKTTIERAVVLSEEKAVQPAIVFNAEQITSQPAAVSDEIKVIEHPALKTKSKAWRYVAAACLLPIAFYSFWLPVKTDVLESGMISLKDFNPFYHSQEGIYKRTTLSLEVTKEEYISLEQQLEGLAEDVQVYSYQYDEDLYIPIRIDRDAAPMNQPQPQEEKTPEPVQQTSGGFDFIVGCFGSQENADKLVENLRSKGFEAYVVDVKNGLRRISAGNVGSKSQLQSLIENAKSQGFDGWVLNH